MVASVISQIRKRYTVKVVDFSSLHLKPNAADIMTKYNHVIKLKYTTKTGGLSMELSID